MLPPVGRGGVTLAGPAGGACEGVGCAGVACAGAACAGVGGVACVGVACVGVACVGRAGWVWRCITLSSWRICRPAAVLSKPFVGWPSMSKSTAGAMAMVAEVRNGGGSCG